MRTLYRYSGGDLGELCRTYSDVVREEFYDGELHATDSANFDITVEKAMAHPISLMRIVSNTGVSYRRTWQHIRNNKVGVRVIWFVQRGSLKFARSRNSCSVAAEECAILDSSQPFYAQSFTDEDGAFEAVQAIVPAHLFLSHLPGAVEFDRPFSIDTDGRHLIGKLLDLLFGEGDHLSRHAADPLVAAFLESLADTVDGLVSEGSGRRQRVVDKRLADIEGYIMKHLTDPDLSYEEVAAKCGISPRYLCYVLKANNTSFSTLLWGQRLPKARDWLAAPALEDYPIQEIAFMAGFKSAAHFSRMFKGNYGCSPKDYRMRARQNVLAAVAPDMDIPDVSNAISAFPVASRLPVEDFTDGPVYAVQGMR
jgi:AraC family transcriptional activator of tynA and feaB